MITEFGEILLFFIVGVIFIGGGLITSWLIRPNRPTKEKQTTYESGEQVISKAWGQFNIRFYLVALVFLLFDVEIVLLFPWATVFGLEKYQQATDGLWGWYAFFEMIFFVFVLGLGLAYAWAKGFLNWEKPVAKEEKVDTPVPAALYEAINEKTK